MKGQEKYGLDVLLREKWRSIIGYEGFYSVSSFGKIRRDLALAGCRAGRILQQSISNAGYKTVVLSKLGKARRHSVHRLVLMAYLGRSPSRKHFAAHGNGDRLDNRPENLRWATRHENMLDQVRHGTLANNLPEPKISKECARQIRKLCQNKIPQHMIAKQFRISQGHVSNIHNGKYWKEED